MMLCYYQGQDNRWFSKAAQAGVKLLGRIYIS